MIASVLDNSAIALEKLRTLLATLAGREETKLPTERALSETFGVSRGAIRRALEVLEADGLVWRLQGSGTYAGRRPQEIRTDGGQPPLATNFTEIMEVRLRIEPPLAQLAAVRATADEIARMRELTVRIGQTEDADARELWDGALHRQIAASARNGLFLALFDTVNKIRQDETWRVIRERARTLANSRETTKGQHSAIIDAIEARDPVGAGEAMRDHLLLIQEILIRQTSLEPVPAGVPAEPSPSSDTSTDVDIESLTELT